MKHCLPFHFLSEVVDMEEAGEHHQGLRDADIAVSLKLLLNAFFLTHY